MSDNITTLQQRIKILIECGVCLSNPFTGSPIKVCQNGHVLCSSCDPQAGEDCPVCRSPGQRIRVQILEEIIRVICSPNDIDQCRYCQLKGLKSDVRYHEAICELQVISCPSRSVPISLNIVCGVKKEFSKATVRDHFKLCILNKIFPVPFLGQKKFVSYFSHLFLNIDSSRPDQVCVNYSNFYNNFVNYRSIRIVSPFFQHFLGHIVFFRRILNHQAVYYFGVKMQLLEEFCSEIKLKICFAKDENFTSNVVQRVVSPISQHVKAMDFYLNPNLFRINANEAAALNSVHVFAFFYIEVQNFGTIATKYPEILGFANEEF